MYLHFQARVAEVLTVRHQPGLDAENRCPSGSQYCSDCTTLLVTLVNGKGQRIEKSLIHRPFYSP